MKSFFVLLCCAALATSCNQPAAQTTATAPAPAAPGAAATAAPADAINTPKAKQLLTQPGTQVLDVRTPVEYLTGHLAQAKNLNVSSDDFPQEIAKLDTSKTYVLYCHSGKRSAKALGLMQQHGFHHLVNGGGYDDLK